MLLQSVSDRFRSARRRWVVAGALLACVATTASVVGAAPSDAQDAGDRAALTSPTQGFTVQLGPEERLYGPSGLTDFPYFSEKSGTKLLGFISNNDSYRAVSKGNRKLKHPHVILKRGKAGSFDKCGAWLIGSIYKRGNKWMALYHAEAAGKGDNNRCIFNDDSVVASIGRAVSNDGGLHWTKSKGGPVITQDDLLNSPKTEDATMGRMIQVGNYLYVYYGASVSAHDTGRKLMVARSLIETDAMPGAKGTWSKWHCAKDLLGNRRCGWSEPGIGGKSTPVAKLDPMARVMTPNTYLGHWIALAATGIKGFKLWVSNTPDTQAPVDPENPDDGTAWAGSIDIYPLVSTGSDPQVDNWNRSRRSKQLYAYPSIVGVNGESYTSGQTFYIYYVKLFPGGDFPERYLMRRKVTLVKGTDLGTNRVALTTYLRKSDGRRRTSTERPIQSSFKPRGTNGYLLGEAREGFQQVFECSKKKDFILRVDQCRRRERTYRRVGWISPTESTVLGATVPIYRCFNRPKKNHFAQRDGCPGYKREALLGYGLEGIS
jgi:hypothetical protein